MNGFDLFYVCALFFFFWMGFIKGFFRSLIGPACLAFWSVIGVINYDLNYNIISAVSITVTGSFICSIIIQCLFFFGKRAVHEQHRHYVFWLSRLLGGAVNMGWNGLLIAFMAIALSLMPKNFLGLAFMQKNIAESIAYTKFYLYIITPFPAVKNIPITLSIFQNPALLEKHKESFAYKAVFNDPKIDRLLKNPQLMKKIQSKDAVFLLNEPLIQDILKDEFLMIKITQLAKRIYNKQTPQ